MGIEVEYRRLKMAEWVRLQKDLEKAASFLFESVPGFDLAKLTERAGIARVILSQTYGWAI